MASEFTLKDENQTKPKQSGCLIEKNKRCGSALSPGFLPSPGPAESCPHHAHLEQLLPFWAQETISTAFREEELRRARRGHRLCLCPPSGVPSPHHSR